MSKLNNVSKDKINNLKAYNKYITWNLAEKFFTDVSNGKLENS